MTLGSLIGDDLRELADLGLIPETAARESLALIGGVGGSTGGNGAGGGHGGDGLDWFEELMEGSRLGRMSRGRRTTAGLKGVGGGEGAGTVSVEWEIVEWTGGESGGGDDRGEATTGNGNGKRKIGEMAGAQAGNDVDMKES